LLLTATPSFALFGLGDIVFDPTSYASLVQQLTTLQMQYNMVKNNITHFSAKQQWQTTLHALENVNVANMFIACMRRRCCGRWWNGSGIRWSWLKSRASANVAKSR
jgi:hypothetical protein